jgi:hypothetical protein
MTKSHSQFITVGLSIVAFIFFIATTGCGVDSTETEVLQDETKEFTVEEINADRGDACECIDASLLKITSFVEKMDAEEFSTSQSLNLGLSIAMSGCMEIKGHREADKAWSEAMSKCESFVLIRDAMLQVRNRALVLKEREQDEFAKNIDDSNGLGVSEILDRLRDGAQ